MRPGIAVVLICFLVLTVRSSLAQVDDLPTLLQPGAKVSGVVPLHGEQVKTFRIRVPRNASMVEVQLGGAPTDLDLYLRHGAPIFDSYEDSDHFAIGAESIEIARISQYSQPPLQAGIYFLDVACSLPGPIIVDGRRLEEVPFELEYKIVIAEADIPLRAGEPAKNTTSREHGYMRRFEVAVPKDAGCLRLDLFDVRQDLMVYVRRKGLFGSSLPQYMAEGPGAREFLVIDETSKPPLRQGNYEITIADLYQSENEVPFTLCASFDSEPPQSLLEFPEIPTPANPLERALLATVEVITNGGIGSGTIISPDGIVLTNYHVVEKWDGSTAKSGEVVIAMNLNPKLPSHEMFRAELIETDKDRDLALLQIQTGFYGQPLPAEFRFQPIPLGNAELLLPADELWVIGYPGIGGLRSRPPITITRGIVSGFESRGEGVVIKTDAQLHAGASGGAALNSRFELIGVPSETVQEEAGDAAGQMGFIRPVTMLDPSWRTRIEAANHK